MEVLIYYLTESSVFCCKIFQSFNLFSIGCMEAFVLLGIIKDAMFWDIKCVVTDSIMKCYVSQRDKMTFLNGQTAVSIERGFINVALTWLLCCEDCIFEH